MQVLPSISAAEVAAHTAEQMREMVQRRVKAAALSGTMAAPRRYQPARDAAMLAHRIARSGGASPRFVISTNIRYTAPYTVDCFGGVNDH